MLEKNLYSYKTFDEIKNNPEIEIVYIVLPNACTLNTQFALRLPVNMFCVKNLWRLRRRNAGR